MPTYMSVWEASPPSQMCPSSVAPGLWVVTVRLALFMLLPGFSTVHLPGLPGAVHLFSHDTFRISFVLQMCGFAALHSTSVPRKRY